MELYGWQMLSLTASAFPPSKNLYKYFYAHIMRTMDATEPGNMRIFFPFLSSFLFFVLYNRGVTEPTKSKDFISKSLTLTLKLLLLY